MFYDALYSCNTQCYLFAIDIPFLAQLAALACDNLNCQYIALDVICSKDFCNLCVAVIVNADAVCYVEISFLTHGLYLGNDFTHEAFFHQFGCQVCVQNNGQVVVAGGYEAVLFCGINQNIIHLQNNLAPSTVKETLPSAFSCAMKPLPSTSFR